MTMTHENDDDDADEVCYYEALQLAEQ